MEEKKQVTPIEGLSIALNQLNNISVPVVLTEQIAIPLARSVDLIRRCIPFLIEKPQEKESEVEPEVKFEILDGPSEEEEGEADE